VVPVRVRSSFEIEPVKSIACGYIKGHMPVQESLDPCGDLFFIVEKPVFVILPVRPVVALIPPFEISIQTKEPKGAVGDSGPDRPDKKVGEGKSDILYRPQVEESEGDADHQTDLVGGFVPVADSGKGNVGQKFPGLGIIQKEKPGIMLLGGDSGEQVDVKKGLGPAGKRLVAGRPQAHGRSANPASLKLLPVLPPQAYIPEVTGKGFPGVGQNRSGPRVLGPQREVSGRISLRTLQEKGQRKQAMFGHPEIFSLGGDFLGRVPLNLVAQRGPGLAQVPPYPSEELILGQAGGGEKQEEGNGKKEGTEEIRDRRLQSVGFHSTPLAFS